LGRQLAAAVVLKPYEAAGKAVEALRSGEVDLGFFAIDPARSQGIAFTAPYVHKGLYDDLERRYRIPDNA
jgi:polar amino acid transport system substrate-binding protein